MATILREWSFRWPPLYDAIATVAALLAGGEAHFRQTAWMDLPLSTDCRVLDLCCGSGGASVWLARRFTNLTGFDANPHGLTAARRKLPNCQFIEGRAEAMPFTDGHFDLVHTSLAMHEMAPDLRRRIFAEAHRVLAAGGHFVLLDFHRPTQPLLWPFLVLFLRVFETETAWQLIASDLGAELAATGFVNLQQRLLVGGSLQIWTAQRA